MPKGAAPAFRGRMTAAPLKLIHGKTIAGFAGTFRGRMTAAPLKRTRELIGTPLLPSFPRSHDRGPIEAIR